MSLPPSTKKPLREQLSAALAARKAEGLHRHRALLDGPQGARIRLDGRDCLNFCSNDYLGLANDPAVVEALREGAAQHGVGSGASHLVAGHSLAHEALEQELADFTGRSRALLFSSGYQANLGVIATLAGSGDRIYHDRLNHASLLDGARLAGARFRRFPHRDPASLARWLAEPTTGRTLVVSDGVFSMDGDIAPLPALAALCREHEAILMVDDAHGLGVLGEQGGGSLAWFAEQGAALDEDDCPVLVGTLGKALGSAGAFVAGSPELIETLIQFCRPYIYTTAMPPALAEATRVSLRLARDEGWRRERLRRHVERFRAAAARLGLTLLDSPTAIQALVLGEAGKAVAASRWLRERGIHVAAIRPPTVPVGSARLRLTLSAAHSDEDLDHLLAALAALPPDIAGVA